MRATIRGTCPVCGMIVSAWPGGIIVRHSGVAHAQRNGWPSCPGTGQRVIPGIAPREPRSSRAPRAMPKPSPHWEDLLALIKPVRRR